MTKVKTIKGNSKAIYNCALCGRKLTEREYYTCSDMCKDCHRENYHRFNRDFVDRNGNNKIDTILIDKYRKGR